MRTLLLLILLAIGAAHAAEPAVISVVPVGGETVQVSPSLLAHLATQEVAATAHEKTSRYTGYDLRAVLKGAGVITESVRGKQLATYLLVTAADGYQVVFSLAELDPTLGDKLVLLTDRENGKPLPLSDGPWRLVVPSDSRPARWVRQLQSIKVVQASNGG